MKSICLYFFVVYSVYALLDMGRTFPRRGLVLEPIFRQSKLEISFWPVLRQEGRRENGYNRIMEFNNWRIP